MTYVIESRGWYLKKVGHGMGGIWTGGVEKAQRFQSRDDAVATFKSLRGLKRDARAAMQILEVAA